MKYEDALRVFKEHQAKLYRSGGLTMKGGGQALENNYSNAYRTLMMMGKAPKIRDKYRQ